MSYKTRPYIGNALIHVPNPFRLYEITDDGKLNEYTRLWGLFNRLSNSITLDGASVEVSGSNSFLQKFRDKGSVIVRGRTSQITLHKLPNIQAFRNAVDGNTANKASQTTPNASAPTKQDLGDTVCVVKKPPQELNEALEIVYGSQYSNSWKKSLTDLIVVGEPLIPYGRSSFSSKAVYAKAPCSGMIIAYDDTASNTDAPLLEILMLEGDIPDKTNVFFEEVFEKINYHPSVPQDLKDKVFNYFNGDIISSRPATDYELSQYAQRNKTPELDAGLE